MAIKRGIAARVTLGTYKVAEIGAWSIAGMANEILESEEFGDEFAVLEFGIGTFGILNFKGNYDPSDSYQELLKSAWQNKSKLTDLRLYVDNLLCWAPDLTNDPDSGILLHEYGAIEYEVHGIGKVAFAGRVTGRMALTFAPLGAGAWSTLAGKSCGNPPFNYTRENIPGTQYAWYYSTGPSAWCTDYQVSPCGFFDVSEHSDENGNVNSVACQMWVPS